jgi:cytochrome c556
MGKIFTAILISAACAFAGEAEFIPDARLENAHKLTPKVWSGGEPHGEAAFQALRELGVKTLLSVDGAKPNLELSKKYGLRYIHVPIGYDGVPLERLEMVAKAFLEAEGPIYVHCHHGKHRGPAAAATGCVAAGLLTNDESTAAMKKMGTDPKYTGLWKAVREAKVIPPEELKNRAIELKEIAPVPPIAEAMVVIDKKFDHLKLAQKEGFKKPVEHPDIDPPHEALQLREVFFEMTRTAEYKIKPADFKKWTETSIQTAKELEQWLRDPVANKEVAKGAAFMESLRKDCMACHKAYRDTK